MSGKRAQRAPERSEYPGSVAWIISDAGHRWTACYPGAKPWPVADDDAPRRRRRSTWKISARSPKCAYFQRPGGGGRACESSVRELGII